MAGKSKPAQRKARTEEIIALLRAVGFPLGEHTEFRTPLRQQRLAHILLAVANLRPDQPFSDLAYDGDGSDHAPKTRDIIRFINMHYGEKIADASYDDIRRKNLDFLVEAGLVERSANRPGAPTNDGTRGYAIAGDAVPLFVKYGTAEWEAELTRWRANFGSLAERLARPRAVNSVDVRLPDGSRLELSVGKHNVIQKAVIEEFLPRFLSAERSGTALSR